MTVLRTFLAVALIFVTLASQSWSEAGGKTALADDLKALEGKWQAVDGPLKGTIIVALTRKDGKITESRFSSNLDGANKIVISLPFELKEDAKKRWVDLGQNFALSAGLAGLSQVFEYRFDGDVLVLKLLAKEGAKGEQRFAKLPADK
jgi:hypothetical protein